MRRVAESEAHAPNTQNAPTDWAAQHREANKDIPEGKCIVCGTNEGLHATVKLQDSLELTMVRAVRCGVMHFLNHLALRTSQTSTSLDGTKETAVFPLDESKCRALAEKGGFWSYVAGTLAVLLSCPRDLPGRPDLSPVRGVVIDNHTTTLPPRKGLSSSAAVCVLVARALSAAHGWGLTPRQEMEVAYRGERLTPSACGRMDQACAFGCVPVLLVSCGVQSCRCCVALWAFTIADV